MASRYHLTHPSHQLLCTSVLVNLWQSRSVPWFPWLVMWSYQSLIIPSCSSAHRYNSLHFITSLCCPVHPQIFQHLRYTTVKEQQVWIVRILFIIPIYGLCSWLGLWIANGSVYFDAVRGCYEGISSCSESSLSLGSGFVVCSSTGDVVVV